MFLYEKGIYKLPENKDVTDGCNCGRNHVTILPNGDVYACRRMESKVGNINENSLYNIWLSDNMNAYRQYDKFTMCAKCELKTVCRGCPSVTYGYTHNMYAADPQCWKEIK